ncbi:rod shape-determining protein MreD [Peptostreptococcus anaerobius]|uniref:rod shape-determining protein MreD n=1 Tax=Peptostreptococcus TaxID=1257 RepID=UPI00189A41B7|nr:MULTISPECIES: rod shape-determining protein MreD [Peptostreptococcus]MBS5595505.1 rod shape-determining protein MreD [Peptostreptococcus sp.]MDB8820842.1 rod shape-determining protein MreD [Peptostreptococcus anaerobius]MDB8825749.1 rod shape-determining protein MreD [Peptostreptococcus anaerobius]MDB8827442.1 rod shape-determining protein MreD [Peptostreptococcus anaerobius]MDB8829272.1 rod shape-determining protein MreD [Peptostreptococcus anaerobius]
MKNIMLFIIGVVILLLETFLTNFLNASVSINFLLVFIILISLYYDKNYSLVLGGILGLISDLVSGGIIGVTGVLFLATSYFISSIEKSIFKDDKKIICLLVYIVSAGYSLLNGVVSAIFFVPPSLFVALLKMIIVFPILNSLIAFVAYILFEDRLKKLRED